MRSARGSPFLGVKMASRKGRKDAKEDGNATPFSPPSGPAAGSFNGFHPKSNFLAVSH